MFITNKKASWLLFNTEINVGSWDILAFFMSLTQNLYNIKYIFKMISYLTFHYGMLGTATYSSLENFGGLSRKSQYFKKHILNPIFKLKCFSQIPLHYNVPGEMPFMFVNRESESRTGLKKFRVISFLPVEFFLFFFLYSNAGRIEIKCFQPLEISYLKDSQEWHRIRHI